MMAVLPCVLFSASDISDANDIIKQLLDLPELPDRSDEDIPQYEWKIDTKYYTAQVGLCAVSDPCVNLCRESPESVQSVVLYFDSEEEKSFQFLDKWLPFLSNHKPEVLIAVCRHCSDFTAISRMTILNWCLKNGFELVELKPDPNDDEEDDFPETVGIARIIQALHAHTWPNLIMKKDLPPSFCQSYLNDLMSEDGIGLTSLPHDGGAIVSNEHNQDIDLKQTSNSSNLACCSDSCDEASVSHRAKNNTLTPPTDANNPHSKADDRSCFNPNQLDNLLTEDHISIINSLASENSDQGSFETLFENLQLMKDNLLTEDHISIINSLASENSDQGSFETLFENLQLMKEKSQFLPHNQRKQYAEKMAVSFWKAIGGDANEIDGLSDSDEES